MAAGRKVTGTIVASLVPQLVLPKLESRKGLAIWNRGSAVMLLQELDALVGSSEGIELPARTLTILPTVLVPKTAQYVACAAPGNAFTVLEGVDDNWNSSPGGVFPLDTSAAASAYNAVQAAQAAQAAAAVAAQAAMDAAASAGVGAFSRTPVNNVDYTVLNTDVFVGYIALTGPHTVTLPKASTCIYGRPLIIADESGACSTTKRISFTLASGDTFIGYSSPPSLASGGSCLTLYPTPNGWIIE